MVTDSERLAPMLEDAIRLANSGRRGPVVLHVPRDLFAAEIPPIDPMNIAQPGLRLRMTSTPSQPCSQMQNVQ